MAVFEIVQLDTRIDVDHARDDRRDDRRLASPC